jgi:hypothetical protein
VEFDMKSVVGIIGCVMFLGCAAMQEQESKQENPMLAFFCETADIIDGKIYCADSLYGVSDEELPKDLCSFGIREGELPEYLCGIHRHIHEMLKDNLSEYVPDPLREQTAAVTSDISELWKTAEEECQYYRKIENRVISRDESLMQKSIDNIRDWHRFSCSPPWSLEEAIQRCQKEWEDSRGYNLDELFIEMCDMANRGFELSRRLIGANYSGFELYNNRPEEGGTVSRLADMFREHSDNCSDIRSRKILRIISYRLMVLLYETPYFDWRFRKYDLSRPGVMYEDLPTFDLALADYKVYDSAKDGFLEYYDLLPPETKNNESVKRAAKAVVALLSPEIEEAELRRYSNDVIIKQKHFVETAITPE